MSEAKIVKQIEYYFSDANIVRDKFLKESISSNEGGYVPLSVLATFNRLKQLSADVDVISAALKAHDSKIYELHEDGKSLKRKKEIPAGYSNFGRCVFANNWPKTWGIDELEHYWADKAKVTDVKIQKLKNPNRPTMSCIIEFATEEECKKAMSEKYVVEEQEIQLVLKVKRDNLQQAEIQQRRRESQFSDLELPKREDFIEGNTVVLVVDLTSRQGKPLHPISVKRFFLSHNFMVSYVDTSEEREKFNIRFKKSGGKTAADVIKYFEDKQIVIEGASGTITRLEGEAEDAFLQAAWLSKCNYLKQEYKKKMNGNNRKRQRDDHNERRGKKAKKEEPQREQEQKQEQKQEEKKEMEVESKTEEVESKTEQVESKTVEVESKTEEVKTEEVKTEQKQEQKEEEKKDMEVEKEVKTEEVKTEQKDEQKEEEKKDMEVEKEVKTEEVKTEEVKTEEVKTEEVKTEEVKTEDVKTEDVAQEKKEVKTESIVEEKKEEEKKEEEKVVAPAVVNKEEPKVEVAPKEEEEKQE